MDEQYGREKYRREKTCPLSLGSERYDYECPMHGSSAAASDARLQQKAVKYTQRERQDLTERLQTRLVLGVKIKDRAVVIQLLKASWKVIRADNLLVSICIRIVEHRSLTCPCQHIVEISTLPHTGPYHHTPKRPCILEKAVATLRFLLDRLCW